MAITNTQVSIPNVSEPETPLVQISIHNSIKLTTSNYLSWKLQMEAILIRYDLQKYVDGTCSAPAATITENNTDFTNPSHQTWMRQDKLLFGALLSTLSSNVIPLVTQATTSLEAWRMLADVFARPTRGHIKQIKDNLKHITKGSKTISEYMQAVKGKADELATLGKPLDPEDLIEKILEGLDETYQSVIDAVNGRDTLISFNELHEKLINKELSLRGNAGVSEFPVSAHPTRTNRQGQRAQTNRQQWSTASQQTTSSGSSNNHPFSQQYSRSPRPFLGKCQWCRVTGHVVSQCTIFKQQFPNATPPATSFNRGSNLPRHLPPWQSQAYLTSSTAQPSSAEPWLLDSGATHHITTNLQHLNAPKPYNGPDEVMIGDGSGLPITHSGSVSLSANSHSFVLSNVLCAPHMKRNLISISQFCKSNNASIEFLPTSFSVKDLLTGTTLLQGQSKDGIYHWPSSSSVSSAPLLAFATSKTNASTWHHRLGHPSSSILQHVATSFNLDITASPDFYCNFCHCSKSHRLPFHTSTLSSTAPLQIIFTDVWTSPIHSIDNYKYYTIFVDHYSKYIWFYPLKRKSDTQSTFIQFKTLVENYFNTTIKTVFSDNGGEYLALTTFFKTHGISHLTSPPHTPKHNGFAERRHRHIVETGLSLLNHASLSLPFWPFAFSIVVYLINRMPTPTLALSSPFSTLFSTAPNYSKLRSFGCLCYPYLRPYQPHKLTNRSAPCLFVGYSTSQSAYLCLELTSHRLSTSRHVQFVETVFPFHHHSPTSPPTHSANSSDWCSLSLPVLQSSVLPPSSDSSSPLSSPQSPSPSSSSSSVPSSLPTAPSPPSLSLAPPSPTGIITRSKNHIFKSIQKLNLHTSVSSSHLEPSSVTHAFKDPCWRYKARLVAKGFFQRPGVDFTETYSPVVKPATVRVVISLAVHNGWPLRQLDVNNAFLQGSLTEAVYMSQPPGFIDTAYPHHVCRLHKAIYGLRQAPRAWYHALRTFLLSYGFTNSIADASLFIFCHNAVCLYLLVYVDDIVVTGSSSLAVTQFITKLSTRFSLKDLGDLHYFLGVEVQSLSSGGLFISQRKYLLDLLHKTHMFDAKPVSTPMASSSDLHCTTASSFSDPSLYRTVVGSLHYLSLTRPDVTYTVNKLSQFLQNPSVLHWTALKRLLRYLRGTLHFGLSFTSGSSLPLIAYSDADWAGNKQDYTSTSAFLIYLGNNIISWCSKKQHTVARSSTEAEYRAVANTAAEIRWLCSLLTELRVVIPVKPVIYCDNVGATHLCANPVFHSRMKHVALDFHFIREQVQGGLLCVEFVPATAQLADVLTKPLLRSPFVQIVLKLGLSSPPSILRGQESYNSTLDDTCQ